MENFIKEIATLVILARGDGTDGLSMPPNRHCERNEVECGNLKYKIFHNFSREIATPIA